MKQRPTATREQRMLAVMRLLRGWIEHESAEGGPEHDTGRGLAQLIEAVLPNCRVALYLEPRASADSKRPPAPPALWVSDEIHLGDIRKQLDAVAQNREQRVIVGGD